MASAKPATSHDQIHSRAPHKMPPQRLGLGAATEFLRCWPWLESSLNEFFPTHTQTQVADRIAEGRAYFWPGRECAIVGQIINHPIGVRDFRFWLQGGGLEELKSMHPGIYAWARERGCDVCTGIGRDGWSKVMEGDWQKGPSTRILWL